MTKKFPNVKIRQENKLKTVFISLLRDIIEKNVFVINELFQTKYFVETQSSKFPFLEGSEEYIFANLINDTYNIFIIKSNYPNNEKVKAYDEKIHLSNYINKRAIKLKMRPIQIIESNNNKINEMHIEENIIKEKEISINKLDPNKFRSKKYLLKPIIEKYCSDEFQQKYEEYLMKFSDKKIKYIYEIILETLFYYCVNFNEIGKMEIISQAFISSRFNYFIQNIINL